MSRSAQITAYETRIAKGTKRVIVTPEGTALDFVIASAGDRAGAFVLDMLLQTALVVAIALAAFFTLGGTAGGWLAAIVLLSIFFIQNFYFIYFEARTNGRTPGKKRLGLRVMDAKGGPLTVDAIVVRNVLRILEFYLPLSALLVPEQLWPGAPQWAVVISLLWMLILAGLPLFNRNRLRVGDIVAGTIVVLAPQARLLPDIGARAAERRSTGDAIYEFTDEQLAVYGVYELQVLEDLLRHDRKRKDGHASIQTVTEKIARKIGWRASIPPNRARSFLQEYYAALRAFQEKRLLFGKRKEDKHAE